MGDLGPWILMGFSIACLVLLVTIGLAPDQQRRFFTNIGNLIRAWRGQSVKTVQSSSKQRAIVAWDHHERRAIELPAWVDEELAAIRAAKGNDSGVALIVRPEDVYWFVHQSGRLDNQGRLDGRIPVWFQRPQTTMEHCTRFVEHGHDRLVHCDRYTGPSGRNGAEVAEPRWMVRNHR